MKNSLPLSEPDLLDVLIVGGGPAGLALANDLHRRGVDFRIIDKKSGPEVHSKAGNLWPRTQEALSALGVRDDLVAVALEYHELIVHAYGKHIGQHRLGGYASPYGSSLQVGQHNIERLLTQHLETAAGPRVEHSTEMVRLTNRASHVEAVLKTADGREETVRSRYLIGCDGSGGTVRKQIGLDFETEALPDRSMRQCDARLRWSRSDRQDQMWFFFIDVGYLAVLPLPGGLHRIWAIQHTKDMPERPPTLAEMQQLTRDITGDPTVELTDAAWLDYQPQFRWGVAPALQSGRVLLCGDAGHVALPIGGQGMNTGVQDAFNLGWKLAGVLQGRWQALVLDSYAVERHAVREALGQDQKKGFERLMYSGRVQQTLVKWLGHYFISGGVETLMDRDEAMLDIAYPRSPLTESHPLASSFKAGDRAPDATVVEVPGPRTTTLFAQIYAGDTWTLLLFEHTATEEVREQLQQAAAAVERAYPLVVARAVTTQPTPLPAQKQSVYIDQDRFAHEAYQVEEPALLLIRPDGHIGFCGDPGTLPQLLTYCSRVFLPAA